MIKTAILIDGGYFLKRLPRVRPDVDATDPEAVGQSVHQLVRGHLKQLNEVHRVSNPLQLLYRTFYYDARPYDRKAHSPVAKRSFERDSSRSCVAIRILPSGWVRFARTTTDPGF